MQFFDNFGKKRKNGINDTNPNKSQDNFKKPKLSPNSGSRIDHQKIWTQRKDLPIFSARKRFLEEVSKAESVILVGETGSGKTTQIPQYLYEERLNFAQKLIDLQCGKGSVQCNSNLNVSSSSTCCITITQPRRVAAISLSHRVREEMSASNFVKTGSEGLAQDAVGYKVRFEDSTNERTRIIFQTDGMLLREAMLDPLLSKYTWVILDEAHERTVNTDILFGIIKAAQKKRLLNFQNKLQAKKENGDTSNSKTKCAVPLKVIVMSATLDAEKFATFFGNAPILLVHGRQYPVNIRHVSNTQDDWQLGVLKTIFQIHREAPPKGDILVFMTGQEEIESMVQQIKEMDNQEKTTAHNFRPYIRLAPFPLYASKESISQMRVFVPAKDGTRKVIVSTNIAETSITLPGICYVVDSCRVKAKVHVSSIGLDLLQVVKISQSQGWQRAGRAGRQEEGFCYRMLTKNEFERLPKDTTPEIKRCSLTSVLLQMLSIGITNVSKFNFLEPPPDDAIQNGLRQLALLEAIDVNKTEVQMPLANGAQILKDSSQVVLTPLGKKMSSFPLEPKFTKAILYAANFGCTEEVITIVSMLNGDQSIFLTPHKKREEALEARKKFISSEGDLITYLNIFRAFKQASKKEEFCTTHFVSLRHLLFASEVRKQLIQLCQANGVPVQSCANNSEVVRKALAQAMFTQVARLTRDGKYVTLDSSQEVSLHPSSVMFGKKPSLVIFIQMIATQKSCIRDLSLADPLWLMEAQPEYFRKNRIILPENE